MNRRSFLKGAAAMVLAPGIVHAENIMKIWVPKGNRLLTPDMISLEALKILHEKMQLTMGARMVNLDYDGKLRVRPVTRHEMYRDPTKKSDFEFYNGLQWSEEDMDKARGNRNNFTVEELKMDVAEFGRRYIDPAIERLAAVTEANINYIPWNRSDWG